MKLKTIKKRLQPKRLVRIKWADSSHTTKGWMFHEDFCLHVLIIESVGYVWEVNGVAVALAAHVTEGYVQAADVMTIPLCSILKVEEL